MDIIYLNQPYTVGSTVTVEVDGTADASVLVENELALGGSTEIQFSDFGGANLGSIDKPMVFRQTFINSEGPYDALLIVSPSDCYIAQGRVAQADADLLGRFFASLDKGRAERAWQAWDKDSFLADNALALAAGLGFEVACAYSMGMGTVACMVAADELKDVFFNASVAFLKSLVATMAQDLIFTPDEVKSINDIINQDANRIKLASVENVAEAIAALASIVIEHEVSNADIKLTLSLQLDTFNLAHVLLHVATP
jgi:hypothetical protein